LSAQLDAHWNPNRS